MLDTNRKRQCLKGTLIIFCVIFWAHMFVLPRFYQNSSTTEPRTYADLELSLCKDDVTIINDVRNNRNIKECPQHGIVTVVGGGRLGNEMWSYVAVWAYGRTSGLTPYLPKCKIWQMSQIFDKLSVPHFEEIGHCPVNFNENYLNKSRRSWSFPNQSITILPPYNRIPSLFLSWRKDILKEFKFNMNLTENAQEILQGFVRNLPAKSYTFIGVHVRRTDYIRYIKKIYGDSAAPRQFYINAMHYYKNKYPNCLFIFISDDPAWCYQEFGNYENVFVTSYKTDKMNTPAEDMAIMAACNHTIIDYGTFGEWGSILAGGEAVYCNLTVNTVKGLAGMKWTGMN